MASDQLGLFGEREPSKRKRKSSVEPAEFDEALRSLGAGLPRNLYLGTSSWYFPGWSGLVFRGNYTEQLVSREGLHAYAQHPLLRTVSLDRSFYQALTAEQYKRYADQVPDHFRFVVKAPSEVTAPWLREGNTVTPNPTFLDAGRANLICVQPVLQGLGAKLGVIVFQISPVGRSAERAAERFADRVEAFLAALPANVPYAFELRDRGLLTARLIEVLDQHGAAYCIGGHDRMASVAEQSAFVDRVRRGQPPAPRMPLVVRWNLHAGFQYEDAKSRYWPFDRLVDEDPDTRHALATLAADALAQGRQVFITINNKAEGSAPASVRKLAEAIAALGEAGINSTASGNQ